MEPKMKHVIFLNGPPRCGKDTVAKILEKHTEPYWDSVGLFKFAQPLRDAACAVFGISDDILDEVKDLPLSKIIDIGDSEEYSKTYTIRKFMIDLSENIIKPKLGQDFFGIKAAHSIIADSVDFSIVSDSGFAPEVSSAIRVIKNMRPNEFSFSIWQIQRNGCSFKHDSRNWIFPDDLTVNEDVQFELINNNIGLTELEIRVIEQYSLI